MPTKLALRSRVASFPLLRRRVQRRVDRSRRPLAVFDRGDRQAQPARHAIAARPDAGKAGAPLLVDDNAPSLSHQISAPATTRAPPSGRSRRIRHRPPRERRRRRLPAPRPLRACVRTGRRSPRRRDFQRDRGTHGRMSTPLVCASPLESARLHLMGAASIGDRHRLRRGASTAPRRPPRSCRRR